MGGGTLRMAIEISNESSYAFDEKALVSLATFTLSHMQIHPDSELSISLVDISQMSDLHMQWMELEGPTDVLSFPMDEMSPGDLAPGMIGDVVLCPEFAMAQAKNGFENEMYVLTAHGILHCLGFDHREKAEEKVMFELQEKLVADWKATR